MCHCIQKEADARILVNMHNTDEIGSRKIIVPMVDTDKLVIFIEKFHELTNVLP